MALEGVLLLHKSEALITQCASVLGLGSFESPRAHFVDFVHRANDKVLLTVLSEVY